MTKANEMWNLCDLLKELENEMSKIENDSDVDPLCNWVD